MASPTDDQQPTPSIPEKDLMVLTDLEQIKVLADPLRVQILEAFMQERTTKQVADLLEEKSTKLYHHVDALERVGLIALTRTKQNRGTLEKYYMAVARGFKVSSDAFGGGEAGGADEEAMGHVASGIFDRTSSEFLSLLESPGSADAVEAEGVLTFMEIRGSEEEMKEIQQRLEAVLQELMENTDAADLPDTPRRFRLTLAYYPLDLADSE